jgi:hypothetical protein
MRVPLARIHFADVGMVSSADMHACTYSLPTLSAPSVRNRSCTHPARHEFVLRLAGAAGFPHLAETHSSTVHITPSYLLSALFVNNLGSDVCAPFSQLQRFPQQLSRSRGSVNCCSGG